MSLVPDVGSCTPVYPGAFRRSRPARSAGVPRWCRSRFVVAIDARPIQACTVLGSTPRASHRQAAVCHRSWIRRPPATTDQSRVHLTAVACSTWPVAVTNSGASACRLSPGGHRPFGCPGVRLGDVLVPLGQGLRLRRHKCAGTSGARSGVQPGDRRLPHIERVGGGAGRVTTGGQVEQPPQVWAGPLHLTNELTPARSAAVEDESQQALGRRASRYEREPQPSVDSVNSPSSQRRPRSSSAGSGLSPLERVREKTTSSAPTGMGRITATFHRLARAVRHSRYAVHRGTSGSCALTCCEPRAKVPR